MVGDIDWKIIETPIGRGALFKKSGRQMGQVAYRLKLFRATHPSRSGIIVDLKRVEGRIDLQGLGDQVGKQFVLHLSDGRRLDMRIIDERGEIDDWSGKGLYKLRS
jgi:hypothetical protein